MKYIAVSKNEDEYQKTTKDEYYRTVSIDTARLLNECIGTKIPINKKEEVVDMCKAWELHEARGMARGEVIGEARGKAIEFLNAVSNLQKNLSCSLEQALVTLGKTLEDYETATQLLY